MSIAGVFAPAVLAGCQRDELESCPCGQTHQRPMRGCSTASGAFEEALASFAVLPVGVFLKSDLDVRGELSPVLGCEFFQTAAETLRQAKRNPFGLLLGHRQILPPSAWARRNRWFPEAFRSARLGFPLAGFHHSAIPLPLSTLGRY